MTGVQYYESGQVPVTQNLQLTTHVPSSANRQTGHCPLAHSLLETATRGHMYPHNSPFPGSSSPDSSPTHVSPRSLPHSHSALNHTHKQGTTPTQLLAAATPRKCVSSGVKGREARRGDPVCAQPGSVLKDWKTLLLSLAPGSLIISVGSATRRQQCGAAGAKRDWK